MSAPTSTNGHGSAEAARRTLRASRPPRRSPMRAPAGVIGSVLGAVKGFVASRIPAADLDERDPDYIRESLPRLWLLCSLYFRGEVRGLGNVPEEGGVLLVGNHSGGNLTPDTIVFTLAFSTYFGVERAFHQLAHNLVLSMPGALLPAQVRHRRRLARRTPARRSRPARRCSSTPAATTRSTGRAGSATGSTSAGARASSGSRSSRTCRSCPWWRSAARRPRCSSRAASRSPRCFGLDRLFRLKVLPISLALPWGLNVGDMLGHIPLPAKITVEALPPIHLREEFGPDPDVDEVYDHVVRLMQDTLDALAAERRLPVIG